MSVQACSGCGQRLAWGLFRCPRCRTVAPLFAGRVKEDQMPHITVAGGPSNPAAAPGEVGYVGPEPTGEAATAVEIRGEHGPEIAGLSKGTVLAVRDFEDMTLAELRKAAKDQGLPTSGSKADLLARLGRGGVVEAVPEEVSA